MNNNKEILNVIKQLINESKEYIDNKQYEFKLSPLQVLIWFIGDGYITRCRNSLCLGLCVNNFTYEEITKIKNLFLNLNIHFNIRSSNYNTTYALATYRKQSILNFYDYIGNCPEELNEFSYKWKTYN